MSVETWRFPWRICPLHAFDRDLWASGGSNASHVVFSSFLFCWNRFARIRTFS